MSNYKVIMILGILAILFSFFWMAVWVDYQLKEPQKDENWDEEDQEIRDRDYSLGLICIFTTLLPGIAFFFFGYRMRLKVNKLKEVADILRAYRRMNMPELAKKLHTNEIESEKYVIACLDERLVNGYMDKSAKAFFTTEYLSQAGDAKVGWKCPSCGGTNNSVILPGETSKCSYCDRIISSEQFAKPKPQQPPKPTAPSVCHWCRQPLVFVSQYGKWYCNYCRRYF